MLPLYQQMQLRYNYCSAVYIWLQIACRQLGKLLIVRLVSLARQQWPPAGAR
jgi:hypothetical protein